MRYAQVITTYKFEYLHSASENLKGHFERSGNDDVTGISECRMREYLESLEHRQHSGTHTYIRVRLLRKFFYYLESEGLIFLSPLRDWNIRTFPKSSFPAIDEKEMERKLSGIRTDTPLCLKGQSLADGSPSGVCAGQSGELSY